MVQESFTTIVLKSNEGCFLTQVEDVNIEKRIVATVVALGKYDAPENWREITKEEADEYNKQRQEAIEAKNAEMMNKKED